MRCSPLKHIKEWLEWLHELKTEHQYLGRYSVEKLCAFNEYQEKTSVTRVMAVIILTPMPTILTLWGLDLMPLRDPRGGAKQHTTTFLRSIFSHTVMTYMFLMAGKQALGLNEKNSNYSHKKATKIALCVAVCLEAIWVFAAFMWRFPVPFREFLGVAPWGILTVIFNYIFAKQDLSRALGRLKRYIPVVGTQLTLFYFLLFLSVGFAAVPIQAQIGMILIFPAVKLTIKRALWKYARNLDDISADVTICMVEISGSLYQTVCMQYVQSNILAIVIMVTDFLQAAIEARTYMEQDYMGDSKNTLQTAVRIVESALFTGAVERIHETSHESLDKLDATAPQATSITSIYGSSEASASPLKVRPIINKSVTSQRDMSFKNESGYESFAATLARLLRKGRAWRRRKQRRSSRKERYMPGREGKDQQKHKRRSSITVTPRAKLIRRNNANSPRGTAGNGVNISREAATSVYINAKVIRRGKSRRILDFGQVYAMQNQETYHDDQETELATASATTSVPQKNCKTTNLTLHGSVVETNRGSVAEGNRKSVLESNQGSIPQSNHGPVTDIPLLGSIGHQGSTTNMSLHFVDEDQGGCITPVNLGSEMPLNVGVNDRQGPIADTNVGSVADSSLLVGEEELNSRPMIRRKSSMGESKLLKKKSSRSVLPVLESKVRRMSRSTTDVTEGMSTTPRNSRVTTDDDDRIAGRRGIQVLGTVGISIDDILIKRKDQARILEQTLQLLFAAEVLLFVEYMEVFMPLLYGACIGGLWHLPNAKYNVLLMNMTYNAMVLEVLTSLLYAMLEVLSFISVYFFIKKRYGISALYQLAFLLETYTMTLQGKLIGCFIAILNSSTLHQGIDITLKFDMDAVLKTPNPYTS